MDHSQAFSEQPVPWADELLTMEEAARFLRVSKASVARLLRHGGIPTMRVGPKSIRFTRRGLLEWLQRR